MVIDYFLFPVFDDSGNFLIFASMVGIKGMSVLPYCASQSVYHSDHLTAVINLYTNKCVRIIGKVTNYWCVCISTMYTINEYYDYTHDTYRAGTCT